MTAGHPDTCGCCTPTSAGTPRPVGDPPGRPTLHRRVGTAAAFSAQMLTDLTDERALRGFTDRRADDPAIGLVDAWSAVLDVLTFYSERLANEGYLRTAEEPRSVLELAHEVGYRPGRGRAAATQLAFTIEDAPGAPVMVPIPRGTKVASLPGPGEVPQNYETTAALDARPRWNAIRARSREPQQLAAGATSAYVVGVRTDLAVGDAVLLVGSERESAAASTAWAFRRLVAIERRPELDATRLVWAEPLGSPSAASGRQGVEVVPAARDARLFVLRRKAAVFGAAAPDFRLISASVTGVTGDEISVRSAAAHASPLKQRGDHHLRVDLGPGRDWPGWAVRTPGQPENTVDLDATYPAAAPGTWGVLARPGVTASYRIVSTTEQSRTDYTLNAKVTRLTLQGPYVSSLFSDQVRETAVWVGAELLPLADVPVVLPVQGDRLTVDPAVPTLDAGRTVVVRGPRPRLQVAESVRTLTVHAAGAADVALHPGDELEVVGPVVRNGDGSITWHTTAGDVTATADQLRPVAPPDGAEVRSEVASVAGPTPDADEVTEISLAGALDGCYDVATVRILGNVAPATHGETRAQVLGSGDATTAYQRFPLAQSPLTYVATAAGGVVSTLEVRVDGRRWTEVAQLYGTSPGDEVYTTGTDDTGAVTVQFGDGRTGARPPSGANNVAATYRVGTGRAGRVGADQLTLPMTRPLGLRSVTNPLAAGLAADPEPSDQARVNAPRTVRTLDRVVSLADVEDFARAVPGMGKARAARIWTGHATAVHLTVAGDGGQDVDAQALDALTAALRGAGDPRLPLVVQAAETVTVAVSVGVVVDPLYEPAAVLAQVTAAITAALSPGARDLGQSLTTGDVLLPAQDVTGVTAVVVQQPVDDVPAYGARMVAGSPAPAQLVVLATAGLTVTAAS